MKDRGWAEMVTAVVEIKSVEEDCNCSFSSKESRRLATPNPSLRAENYDMLRKLDE
jgi:hypothetical protein